MPKEFDVKKFITENRILVEDVETQKLLGEAYEHTEIAERAVEKAMKERGQGITARTQLGYIRKQLRLQRKAIAEVAKLVR